MTRQTYLLRKTGRYHFRRRFTFFGAPGQHITVALGTADPVDARRLVHRLAARWDEVTLAMEDSIERGTLTLSEQHSLMRKALESELADATRSKRGILSTDVSSDAQRKVLIAAYRIVGAVPHDTPAITRDQIAEVIDASWSPQEQALLEKTLRLFVTPMTITRAEIDEALRGLGTPVNESTCAEARWMMFRGRIEAQERAALVSHPLFAGSIVPGVDLLDDAKVEQARKIIPAPALQVVQPPVEPTPFPNASGGGEHWLFAKTSTVRFSEQIDELERDMFEKNRWQPDNGKTRLMLQSFAWLTGDKIMSDYEPADIIKYKNSLSRVPKNFQWGKIYVTGGMATPYDPPQFPSQRGGISPDLLRGDRTINSYLSKLQAASRLLAKAIGFRRLAQAMS